MKERFSGFLRASLPRSRTDLAGTNMKINPEVATRLKVHFLLGTIVLLTLLLYGQTIWFGYVWDDPLILDFHVSPLLENGLTVYGLGQPFLGSHYFRPLVVLLFCLETDISGRGPWLSHGVNLIFFVANLVLVFWLALRIAKRLRHEFPTRIAFFSAFIYALHPALTEPVAWIAGRFDLLVTTFILCATHVFLGNDRGVRSALVFALFSLCALLSKENALLIPFSLFFLHLALLDHEDTSGAKKIILNFLRKNLNLWVAFAGTLFIYFSYRQYSGNHIHAGGTVLDHFREGIPFVALKLYFQDAFVPFYGISPRHPVIGADLAWIDILACFAAVAVLFWILFLSFRKRSVAASIFIAGFLYLVPVLLLIPERFSGNAISDRYLAAPLAFWGIAVCMVHDDLTPIHSLSKRFGIDFRVFWALPAGWLIMAMVSTAIIIPVWKNNMSLWSWSHIRYPDDKFSRTNYFSALLLENQMDRLEKEIQKLLESENMAEIDLTVWALYGNVLVRKKDPVSLTYLEALVDSTPIFKLHLLGDSPDQAGSQPSIMDANLAVNVFLSYSLAAFVLEKDIPRALALNTIARWYAARTGVAQSAIRSGIYSTQIEYDRILYLYASGEFDAAGAALNLLAPQARAVAKSYTRRHLKDFCQEKLPEYAATCNALQASGLI
jgi:hypothetical protein